MGGQGQKNHDALQGALGTHWLCDQEAQAPRVGRFLSLDPLAAKYPHNSPYAFSENRVIDCTELEGLETEIAIYGLKSNGILGEPKLQLTHSGPVSGEMESVARQIMNVPVGPLQEGILTLIDIGAAETYLTGGVTQAMLFTQRYHYSLSRSDSGGDDVLISQGDVEVYAGGNALGGIVHIAPILLGQAFTKSRTITPTSLIQSKAKQIKAYVPQGAMMGKRIGHTFTKHGSHNTNELTLQAKNSGIAQGQWLDDVAAESFIASNLGALKNGAKTIPLTEGLGRVINPDGSHNPAKYARLVPSKSGVITAYPTNEPPE